MLKKTSAILFLLLIAASFLLVSCGGSSGSSSGAVPEVVTDPGSNPIDGNTDPGGTTGNNTTNTTPPTVIINPSGGDLTVNGESVPPADFNSSNTSANVTANDGTGDCTVTVSNDGVITIIPADGSLQGTYTVTIDTGDREYVLIVEVNANGDPVVSTSISYPAGSDMVLDLDNGKVMVDGQNYLDLTLSSPDGANGTYVLDESISSIIIKDKNGDIIASTDSGNIIDPVTGDIISGTGADSYVITIIKTDGTTITLNTDQYGKITSIPADGISHVLIDVDNGTATIVPATTIGGITIEAKINIAGKTGSDWVKLGTITEIKAYTANGSVDSPDLQSFVDPNTGSIAVPGLLFTATTVVITENITNGLATHIISIDEDGDYKTYSKSEITVVNGVETKIITVIGFDDDGQISSYIQTSVVKDNGTTTTTITTVGVNTDGSATVTVVTTVISPDGSTTTTTATTTVNSNGNGSTVTNVTYNRVMVVLTNGSITSGDTTLTLTGNSGTGYKFLTGVQILSASAADGTIPVTDLSKITVDPLTGSIMINGNGTITLVGPYELKVSIGDKVYVLKTDETGRIVSIIPGNVVLQLLNGVMFYSDNDVLTIAYENNDVWALSNKITELKAVDASGNISIIIDPYTGNFVTDKNVTGIVTITFIYTDVKGNGITYTVIVNNGSVSSYTAEITNPSSDFDFSTVTNIKVFLNVVDNTTGLPVKQASISLANTTSENWKGFTDDFGMSIFTATVSAASQTTSIAVTHAGYVSVESPINGIGKLIEIGKKIAMTPEVIVTPPTDSDNDGVADSEDDYPFDPTGAKMITGSYTFGFEDQYDYNRLVFNSIDPKTNMPKGNDADFNDLVVRLSIEEKIDSQNRITKITLKAKTIGALSGANNSFGIYVNGQKYLMIPQSRIYASDNSFVLAPEVTQTISFEEGIARNIIGAMPYDPFMPKGVMSDGKVSEVHLASVNTAYLGNRKGNGYLKTGDYTYVEVQNFVWALIVPENWQWPNERKCIAIAYPTFVNWCNTDGKQDFEWYNNPNTIPSLSDNVVLR